MELPIVTISKEHTLRHALYFAVVLLRFACGHRVHGYSYTRYTTVWYALAANVIEKVLRELCFTLPPTLLGVGRYDTVPGLVF